MYELALRTNKNVKKTLAPKLAPKNVIMNIDKLHHNYESMCDNPY